MSVDWNGVPLEQTSERSWRRVGAAFCAAVYTADGALFVAEITLGPFRWKGTAQTAAGALYEAERACGEWCSDFATSAKWMASAAAPKPMPAKRGPYTMTFCPHGLPGDARREK